MSAEEKANEKTKNNNEENFVNCEANDFLPEIFFLSGITLVLTYYSLCHQQPPISLPIVNLNGEWFTNMEIQNIVEHQTQKVLHGIPPWRNNISTTLHLHGEKQYFCLHL